MINQRSGEVEEPYVYCPHCGSNYTEEAYGSYHDYYCQKCCEFFDKENVKK
jgi:transposase-like protein